MFRSWLTFALIVVASGKNEEYMGYKVYNVKLETQEQQDLFHELKSDLIDYWRKPSLKYNVVGKAMVPPSHFDWFEQKLDELGVAKDAIIEDVYQYLLTTDKNNDGSTRTDNSTVFDFNGYYDYEQIADYIYSLQEMHADTSIVLTVEHFGDTAEGRPLLYMKLTSNATNTLYDEKPIIVIEAAINPREWITVSAALYIVDKLIENYDDQKFLLDEAEWVIVPVLNPDGYQYTRTNLRLWTKSRSISSSLGFVCPGVNLNRNFNMAWGVFDSSSSPCSHLFAGSEPFSEIETQLMKYLIDEYGSRTKLYVSLQNNGGFVTYPWSYERAASGMFRQYRLIGGAMVSSMEDEYNHDVSFQAISDRISGAITDFVHNSGVVYTFTIEAVSMGVDGVQIPEEDIGSVITDIFNAVETAALITISY